MAPQRSSSAEKRAGQGEFMDRRGMAEGSGMMAPGVSVFHTVLLCSTF